MERACYGRPDGPLVTPQEFVRKASPRYKELGVFPYCEACGQKVDLYGVHRPEGPSRFDHQNLPEDADPLDDCVLANRNARFKGMQPKGFDFEHGRQLREKFFETDNLKRAYCFMWKLCGKNNLPIKTFVNCLKRADKKNIWSYVDIPLWIVPYILLTLDNFNHMSGFKFHFYIDKKANSYADDLWIGHNKNYLCKVFTDSGKLIDKMIIPNPLPISEKNYLNISSDTLWVEEGIVNFILQHC